MSDGRKQHLLGSDSYERGVTTGPDGESWSIDRGGLSRDELTRRRELSVGEGVSGTYTVPGAVSAGSYTLHSSVAALWEQPGDGDRGTGVLPFEVELGLTPTG